MKFWLSVLIWDQAKKLGSWEVYLFLFNIIILDTSILSFILPEGLTEYFELDKFELSEGSYHIYLLEKNIHPEEYSGEKLISKGFFDEITVRDFPLRGKPCFLKVKRRKWQNLNTKKIVFRDWNLVADGTKMTTEFAFFFEKLFGFKPNKL